MPVTNSSLGSASFRVMTDDKHMFPLPVRDTSDPFLVHYRARVRALSETEYKNLNNNIFVGTFKRARQSLAVMAQIEAGTGAQTLTVPIMSGERQSFTLAYLISCDMQTHAGDSSIFEGDIDVVLLDSDITP